MQDAQNTAISNEYRSVPISILVESATNPRKRFDEKNLEELAASMRAQGILAPLLVRELEESKYEVVAGARRLRAAKLAELDKLPVRVVKLTDAEASRPNALRTCNARTSTRLRKLWDSSRSWNSESLSTPSPPSPHVLARARLTSTVALDSLTSYRLWPRHF